MDEYPSLSVVIPNYNHGAYLGECLGAILTESIAPFEVIVIDDGSTDDSLMRLRQIAALHPTVRLYRNPENRGVVYTLNRGMQLARGEFVYPAAADDRINPGIFESSLRLLARYPKAGLCFTDIAFLEPDTGRCTPKHLGFGREAGYLSPSDLVAKLRYTGDTIAGCGTMLRRDAWLEIGGFDPRLRWHCDWFAVFVMAFRYGACYVPEPLSSVRMTPGAYSQGAVRDPEAQRAVVREMLAQLERSEFKDVVPAFRESGVLSKFGLHLLALALEHREFRPWLYHAPYRRILGRELKDLLIRFGPQPLRRSFWMARNLWQGRGRSVGSAESSEK